MNIPLNDNSSYFVSVIIPAYNAESFIQKTVRSVIQQNYKNFEIIIVNDGSTDRTIQSVEDVMREYKQISLISIENRGVSNARNVGLRKAKGDYVCFLDSDDRLDSQFLTLLTNKIKCTDSDAVFCGYHKWFKQGYINVPAIFPESVSLYGFLSHGSLFHIGSILVKKEFLTKNNIIFNEKLALGEDLLFIYTILSLAKVSCVNSYLYHYIYHEKSVMCQPWNENKFFHDIESLEITRNVIDEIYLEDNKDIIIKKINSIYNERKIRFLWKLIQSKKFDSVKRLMNSDFIISIADEPSISKKFSKKWQVIKSNNRVIWFFTWLFSKKKNQVI